MSLYRQKKKSQQDAASTDPASTASPPALPPPSFATDLTQRAQHPIDSASSYPRTNSTQNRTFLHDSRPTRPHSLNQPPRTAATWDELRSLHTSAKTPYIIVQHPSSQSQLTQIIRQLAQPPMTIITQQPQKPPRNRIDGMQYRGGDMTDLSFGTSLADDQHPSFETNNARTASLNSISTTDSIPATHITTNASSNPTSSEEYQLNPTYDLDHYDIIHRCFDLELSSRTACLIFSVNKFVADQTAMRLRIKAFHNTPYQFKIVLLVHESTNLNTLSSPNQSSSLPRNQQHNSHPSHIHQKHEDVTHGDNNQSTTTNNLEVILNDLNILCLANDLRFILTFDFREAARYIETVTILEQETKNGTRNMSVLVDYLRTAAIGAATTTSKRPQFATTTTSALPTGLLINDNSNTKQYAISILSSLPTLSSNIIESLISHFGTFRSIVTNLPHLTKAESVGAKRQQTIQDLFNCNFADVIAAREAQSGTAVHHP